MAAARQRRTHDVPTTTAFDAPVPTPDERKAAAKAIRKATPRSVHGTWEPATDRPDPVELLVEQNRTRVPELVPLRFGRMATSPFAFLRGSALVMSHDLAATPDAGIEVEVCGDAHLANFGIFASPERRLMFDLNDFDETALGPFEWDVKRLAASLVVAARANGFDRITARRAVLDAVAQYRDWMERYSAMTHLEVWYARIDVRELIEARAAAAAARRRLEAQLTRFEGKNHLKAFAKLTVEVDGRRRIVDDPPVVEHVVGEDVFVPRLEAVLAEYRLTLSADRRALFDRYRFVDFARKVVGVGSVGTRCWVALFQGPNGGPLFLQLKEANRSVVEQARGTELATHQGQRVVEGQRMLQATSDVLLGWGTDEPTGHHYYVRQLWDAKGSIDVTTLRPAGFGTYAGFCGWALARAHARTGDSVSIHGYLGNSERFGESIADFAEAYADQTERDHALLVTAIERGAITAII
ncbi:MAG: DUF2252 domain-containing protein [Actinobacteria bacterium]|uniref:Unannotated protein n=1 Tax=freshwater metagenome TaxID=449393 RepID=A0A6J6CEI9_9ZZZZ|nr:DUF2252 domain-containing protein [Actinomycetota bacterium]